jgi:hypothetical protein
VASGGDYRDQRLADAALAGALRRVSANDGLFDRRRGQPSAKRVPLAAVEQVLGLYGDRYPDLNVRHFHEKLSAEHRIELSYSGVKQALQGRDW